MTITNFNPAADSFVLNGYAANSADVSSAGGSTLVTLSDNTRIELIGVTNLPASAIG